MSSASNNTTAHNSQHGHEPGSGDEDLTIFGGGGQENINTHGADELLDEIDSLLEHNAEDFVRSYVQKGGQ